MNATDALTVSELTLSIKKNLEHDFQAVMVQGEISNFKKQASGHIYFSLKDKDAQISAALFRGFAAKCVRLPKDGDHVTLFGDISVYPPRGSYQIIVKEIQFVGLGQLLLKLHALKEALSKKGWFDPAGKKKLPALPKRIGIVTSPTGAVIQDVMNVLKRRFSGFQLLLNPVKVQGEGAAEEIARAIYDFNRYDLADVLIVGRGGGSLEDLWAFNEEIVAKAIFESRIPVISAVGHETDHTICDLVADIRAPTPSAAAEIVVKEKAQLLEFLRSASVRSGQYLQRKISELRKNVGVLSKHPHFASPHALMGKWMQDLDEKRMAIDVHMKHLLETKRIRLSGFQKTHQGNNPIKQIETLKGSLKTYRLRLEESLKAQLLSKREIFEARNFRSRTSRIMENRIAQNKERLLQLRSHLKSLDPKNLLKKGYSILFSEKKNSLILSARDVKANDSIKAIVADGKIHATVTYIKSEMKE